MRLNNIQRETRRGWDEQCLAFLHRVVSLVDFCRCPEMEKFTFICKLFRFMHSAAGMCVCVYVRWRRAHPPFRWCSVCALPTNHRTQSVFTTSSKNNNIAAKIQETLSLCTKCDEGKSARRNQSCTKMTRTLNACVSSVRSGSTLSTCAYIFVFFRIRCTVQTMAHPSAYDLSRAMNDDEMCDSFEKIWGRNVDVYQFSASNRPRMCVHFTLGLLICRTCV